MPDSGYNVGEAFLTIVPSFKGLAQAISREAQQAGTDFARIFNDTVRRETNNAPLGPSEPSSSKQGQKSGGAFATSFKAQVAAALKSLPEAKIGVATTEAEQKLKDLRAELETLSKQTVGVDISDEEALAKIDRIKSDLTELARSTPSASVKLDTLAAAAALEKFRADLDRLSTESPDVDVDVNTSGAETHLAALRASISGLGGASVNVDVITGPALAGINAIKTGLLTLSAGAAITPIVAGATSLLGPLTAAIGGGVGVGASSLPGLTAVKNALTAQSAAQKATTTSATQSASAQVSAANQIKSAELSLADTRRRVANDRITSAQSVKTAEGQVTQAEQQLRSADQASLAAQQALTAAREAATRSLQDQAFAAQDAALGVQQDQLALIEAQQNQAAVNASMTSTALQQQEAALAVAQAQQALTEQQVTATRATEDNTKAQKAGVAGSPQVVAAQKQITTAHQSQVQAQKAVTQAQQQLANARRAAALQEKQDASDLVRAQLAVAQAQASANSSLGSGTAAANTYGAALASLTPQEAALLSATQRFKTAFTDFGHALEPATLPLFTNGLGILAGLLPRLEPLIHATAGALGEIEQSFAKAVKGPGLSTFLNTLTSLVGPALHDLAGIGGNLGKTFANVVSAFAPLSGTVLGGLKQLTGELAKASSSPAVKQFVALMVKLGPSVVSAFTAVGGAVGSIVKALAPLAGPVLSVITTLAKALSGIVTQVGPSIAALFKTLAPVINAVITDLAPVITGVIKTLAPVLGPLITALAKGFIALLPAVQPIATLIGVLVTALAPILPLLGRMIGALLPPLARLFTAVAVALTPVVGALVTALAPVIPQIAAAFGQFVTALQPIFPILGQVLVALVPLIPPLAQLAVQILQLAVKLLPILIPLFKLLPPIISFLTTVINSQVKAITDLVKWIGDAITWFKHFGQHASDAAHAVSSAWNSAWGAIRGAWTSVRDFLTGEWSKFTRTAGRLWGNIADAVTGAFGSVRTFFANMWTDVENTFVSGVNWVINHVLRPIVGILDAVLGVFGIKIAKPNPISTGGGSKSSSGSKPANGGQPHGAFAAGGVLPGYTPGTDGISLPRYQFSGGEGILVPEATRALGGVSGIAAINSMFSARVSPPNHFAGGGTIPGGADIGGQVVGSLGSFLGGLGQDAVGTITSAVAKVKDAIRRGAADAAIAALKVAEAPIKALLGTAGTPLANQLASGVFSKLNSSVYDYIRGHVKAPAAAAGGGGRIPTGQHLALIMQALGAAGVPATGPNEASVNTIVDYESGWNPNAINLTDSNAQAGHPSQGLMQTIPGTFEAYRLKSLPDVITDPLANLVAGIRYAVSRYGSLESVPGVASVNHGGGYVGYDNGGYLPPGLTTVFNGTGRPEPVFTSEQFAQMSSGRSGVTVNQTINPSAGLDEVGVGALVARQLTHSLATL